MENFSDVFQSIEKFMHKEKFILTINLTWLIVPVFTH